MRPKMDTWLSPDVASYMDNWVDDGDSVFLGRGGEWTTTDGGGEKM